MDDQITKIRSSYLSGELREEALEKNPIAMFTAWMSDAVGKGIEEPNGMALATVSAEGLPAVRLVLLRGFDAAGFVFYTNYDSAKGRDLETNPVAAATFWWSALERQVRVCGRVQKTSREESEAYFRSRPRGHQLAAWASPQSRPVNGRAELKARQEEVEARFPGEVPLPDFWGGYRIIPESIEFWQGRENRLHDRFLYKKVQGNWTATRLAP